MNETDYFLTKQVTGGKSPAVQYIIFDTETIIHRFQCGLADVKLHKPVDWNTTFNAFSVTKTFTALAVLLLAEKGNLSMDDRAQHYLPDFPYSNDITIKQLLTHSSGVPNPNPLSWIHLVAEHKTFDRNVFFEGIFNRYNKSKYRPNEKFVYSNLGYFLLGQLIEHVSGLAYEDFIRENVLKPLHIGPGELEFEIYDNGHQAKGYQKRLGLMNGIIGFFIDKKKYMDKAEGKWRPFKNYYVNGPSYGGLIGSPDGFRKYLQELLKKNCSLITNEHKKLLFRENSTNSNKATGMCLSWFRGTLKGHEYFTHAGGGGGYYDEIRMYPDLGIGSVIMYNRSGMTDKRILDKVDLNYIDK